MAHRDTAPYKPQDPYEVARVLHGLEEHKKGKGGKLGFSTRKNTFDVAGTKHIVDSWRIQEWDYKKPNLPTYARGLFAMTNSKGMPEIVVRGYDKFFNHGEISKTQWNNIEKNTRGPYELSVKENGCIIFISGLEDETLLVCSKHSTGAREEINISHALAGEKWVDRHLASVGKTRRDLALKLREMNATAVAELCDDEFEEHVLAYSPETAGLYLHGINLNLPEFVTYPGHLVGRFAQEWGFKQTMYVIEDDITQVKTFLDKVAETGNYNGRDTEGFVVRCQCRESGSKPWEDWFFKYKFEEPYLMYRQWRECTKALIADKPPRYKKHQRITEEYLWFARNQLGKHPELAKAYNQNHGIIKMRDDFLAEVGLRGSDIIRQEMEEGQVSNDKVSDKVVLVPVATLGCGKTTVALALCKLFGWGHIQNDNITKKPKPLNFAKGVRDGLVTHPVMIADRNNHQRRERKQAIDDISRITPGIKFVALHYVHDRSNYDQIRTVTRDRVLSRGDNHQTIQAGSKGQDEIVSIMEGFMHRFEPVDPERDPDDGFDKIINLDVGASSRENLEHIVAQLSQDYPGLFKNMPTGDDLDNAIKEAMNDYKPDIKHEIGGGNAKREAKKQQKQQQQREQKPAKLEYFGVNIPVNGLTAILDDIFANADYSKTKTWTQLKEAGRIQHEFHVTLIHRTQAQTESEYWDELSRLHNEAAERTGISDPEIGKLPVQIERLIWDNRLMCFIVRLLGKDGDLNWRTVNPVAHITVGTVNPSVKPVESNDLIQSWLHGKKENGIQEKMVMGNVELPGTVRAVLQRR